MEDKTQASALLTIAQDMDLFKTPGGEMYANLPIDGRTETHPLKSTPVRNWLTLRYTDVRQAAPSKTALESVMAVLEAKAQFRSETHEVYVRVAAHEDALYLDLHNGVVKITGDGWNVISEAEAPVRFRRPRGALHLPHPVHGGSLSELRKFLNLPDGHDAEWVLTVGWLLSTLHPTGPYPILALHGEKGSAKSTTTRYLRQLIDPSIAPAPVQPRDGADLTLKAHNNHVVACDNMSSMPRWLSDGLCRLSTGAGDSKRQLYADSEEVIFTAKRPCILNGIEELATAGDLLDRTVIVSLPVIPEERRQSDAGMAQAFEEARPRLLGALCDAASAALRNREGVHLDRAPRMRDFAEWVVAAEMDGGLGWPEGSFLGAYMGNRENAQRLEIEASPVATAVVQLMENIEQQLSGTAEWSGPASELLEELASIAGEKVTRQYPWPKDGKRLSDQLMRVAGALRSEGIEVERGGRSNRSRSLILRKGSQINPTNGGGACDARDAEIHPFPVPPTNEEREEIGKPRKAASPASPASTTWPPFAEDTDEIPF